MNVDNKLLSDMGKDIAALSAALHPETGHVCLAIEANREEIKKNGAGVNKCDDMLRGSNSKPGVLSRLGVLEKSWLWVAGLSLITFSAVLYAVVGQLAAWLAG